MVSEDSRELTVLKSFLLIFRRDVCASPTIGLSLLIAHQYPTGVTRKSEYRMDTPGFPAYGQLHSPPSPAGGAAPLCL